MRQARTANPAEQLVTACRRAAVAIGRPSGDSRMRPTGRAPSFGHRGPRSVTRRWRSAPANWWTDVSGYSAARLPENDVRCEPDRPRHARPAGAFGTSVASSGSWRSSSWSIGPRSRARCRGVLTDQRRHRMLHVRRRSAAEQHARTVDQPIAVGRPAITARRHPWHGSAVGGGHQPTALDASKIDPPGTTLRRRRRPPSNRLKSLSQPDVTFRGIAS